MDAIRRMTADYYGRAFAAHGDTPQGVDWNGREGQRLRLELLLADLPLSAPFSLLDVGCGSGALAELLQERGAAVRYHGIDFVPAMVEAAAAKQRGRQGVRFSVASLAEVGEQYDFVVASGIFNVKQAVDELAWTTHFHETVGQMFARCTKAIAFNCLTSQVDFRRDHLFYPDPAESLRFCLGLSRAARLQYAYPLYEYTLTVYRDELAGRPTRAPASGTPSVTP